MKKQEIIAEGLCGMQVNFNLQDMHAAANFVNTVNDYFTKKAAYDKWHDGYWDDSIRYKTDPETGEKTRLWNNWSEYENLYPKPKVIELDKDQMLKDAVIFFKKVASKSETEASIFSEEDEQ